MADRFDKKTRSAVMSAVRNKNTAPEMAVRQALFRSGYRYRLHQKSLPGSPDIVLKRFKAVIFVNGCFWHGHDCPRGKGPKTNKRFWSEKIKKNRCRDAKVVCALEKTGWRVFVIWECRLQIGIEEACAWLSKQRSL